MPMSAALRFDGFELDPANRTLQRGGRRVPLQEKPFEALRLLASRPGELVSREELRQALWPEQRFLEFEHGLDAVLNKLRRALGESASRPRLIETVRGRGYRFAGRTEPAPTRPRALVVVRLPRTLSREPQDAHLAEGLLEELATALGGLRPEHLGVVAGEQPPPEGARLVVEGSVRVAGERARISIRLTEPLSRTTTWAESFEGPLDRELALQHRAAEAVCRQVGRALAPRIEPIAVNSDACAAFLRARFAMARRTRAGLARSLEELDRALRIDPRYARAHAARAEARVLAVEYGLTPESDGFPAAADAAREALHLDPELAEPHAVLGFVRHRHEWRWGEAEREYRHALALDPHLATGHQWLAELLSQLGRFDEALHEAHRACELDPLSSIARSVTAWIAYHARRFDEVLAVCGEVLERDPDFAVAHFVAARTLVALGRAGEAIAEAERAVVLSEESPYAVAALAIAFAKAGRGERARALLDRLTRGGATGSASPYLLAKTELALGRRDRALDSLEQARVARASWLTDLAVDPDFDALRAHPRFVALVTGLGLPVLAA